MQSQRDRIPQSKSRCRQIPLTSSLPFNYVVKEEKYFVKSFSFAAAGVYGHFSDHFVKCQDFLSWKLHAKRNKKWHSCFLENWTTNNKWQHLFTCIFQIIKSAFCQILQIPLKLKFCQVQSQDRKLKTKCFFSSSIFAQHSPHIAQLVLCSKYKWTP